MFEDEGTPQAETPPEGEATPKPDEAKPAEPEKKFTQADLNKAEKRWKTRARGAAARLEELGFTQGDNGEWNPPEKQGEPKKEKGGEDDYKRGYREADKQWQKRFKSVEMDRAIERELSSRGLHADLVHNVKALADITEADDIGPELDRLTESHPLFQAKENNRSSSIVKSAPTVKGNVLTPGRNWKTSEIAAAKRQFGGTAPKEYQEEWSKARKEGRITIDTRT